MDINKEELASRYREMSDDELLRRVTAGTLTELAQEIASAELAARGIDLPELVDDEVTEHDSLEAEPESHSGVDLVTIARIINPLRANLLKVHLESEGIFTHLLGGHLGVVDLYLSAGSGGVHVQVRKDQAAHALEVLAKFDEIEKEIYESRDQNSITDPESRNKRRESLNNPASSLFFWFFTVLAFAAIAVALIG
jgi:hypothetical protein